MCLISHVTKEFFSLRNREKKKRDENWKKNPFDRENICTTSNQSIALSIIRGIGTWRLAWNLIWDKAMNPPCTGTTNVLIFHCSSSRVFCSVWFASFLQWFSDRPFPNYSAQCLTRPWISCFWQQLKIRSSQREIESESAEGKIRWTHAKPRKRTRNTFSEGSEALISPRSSSSSLFAFQALVYRTGVPKSWELCHHTVTYRAPPFQPVSSLECI